VRGDVQLNGDAEIASGGSVEGNVQADAVDIAGSLQGDVNARGAIAIRSGAVVRGELKGSEVSIEPGSRISVRLETEIELDLGGGPKRR
jgi:cytoskeletal protein CcmA (bactofilin family)